MHEHHDGNTVMNAVRAGAIRVVDAIADPLVLVDLQFNVIAANLEFCRLFGVVPEQTRTRPIFEIGDRQLDIPELKNGLDGLFSHPAEMAEFDITRDFPGLGRRMIRIGGRRIAHEADGEEMILLSVKDRTEQILSLRALKTAEARYQRLIEETASIIIAVDARGMIRYMNRYAERIFGYSRNEVIGRPLAGTLMEKQTRGRDNAALIAGLFDPNGDGRQEYDSVGRNKNGEEVWFSWNARIDRQDGERSAEILIDGVDLTGEQRERLKARETSAMIEASPDLMIRLDTAKRYRFANRAFLKLIGKPAEAVIGKPVGDFGLSPETLRMVNETLDTVIRTKQTETIDFFFHNRVYLATVTPARDESGGLGALMIFARDITARRETEEDLRRGQERLRQSEERFRAVLENSLDAAYRRDLETDCYDYISPVIEGMTGFTPDEFNRMGIGSILDRIHPDDLAGVLPQLEGEIGTDRTWGRIEYRFCRKNGDYVWLADNFRILRGETGAPRYRVGIMSDITGHKQMEENLFIARETAENRAREAEAGRRLIEAVLDNVPDGFAIIDAGTRRVQMVSQYLADFAGRRREDFRNITLEEYARYLDIKQLSGEPVPFSDMPIFRSLFHGELVLNVDYLLTNIKGETITVQVNTAPVRDAEDRIVKGIVIWRNIEHLKRIEAELRTSRDAARQAARQAEERQRILETILVSIPEGITIASAPFGELQLVSRYYVDFIGIAADTLKKMPLEKRLESIEFRRVSGVPAPPAEYPVYRALHRGEVIFDEEWSIRRSDGKMAVVSVIAAPVRDDRGEVTHAVMSFRDVTESKMMETALRRNEYELRTLVESSPDVILRIDHAMRYVFVNAAYEHLTGVPRERFIGKTNREMGMPPEQCGHWEDGLSKVFQTGREINIEFSFKGLFGKRFFWGRIIPEFDRSGAMETAMMVARDITERKQAEERIRYVSFHDNVTGLYNRAYFEEEVRRLDSGRLLPVSIIMGDVNNLKLVNDTFGHQEGDVLLRIIADLLRETCRDEDIVARWGGDEFAVILPETDPETAREVISRIRDAAGRAHGAIIRPSIALGTAAKTSAEENIHAAIRRAETQMYDNKLAESKVNQEMIQASLLGRVSGKWKGLRRHLERTRQLALAFGRSLELNDSQMEEFLLLVNLHEIGKVGIPEALLLKRGSLSDEEWSTIRRYPESGYRIVKTFSDTAKISEAVLTMREHWDGTGYPRGLKEREIPYLARAFSIIDVYDIITHERPYGRAFSREEAAREIAREAGRQFDPELADRFVRVVADHAS